MKKKVFLSAVIVIVLTVVAFPYAKVEYFTSKYVSEFEKDYMFESITSEIDYMKVYSYSEEIAEVYIVTNDRRAGIMCLFRRDNEIEWRLKSWEAVWSKSGSASKFIWPYYR